MFHRSTAFLIVASTLSWTKSLGLNYFQDEPQDAVVCEGGEAKFLCRTDRLPIVWYINGTSYSREEIDPPHYLNIFTNTLTVNMVQLWMNSTTYRCTLPGLANSKIGTLIVVPGTAAMCSVTSISFMSQQQSDVTPTVSTQQFDLDETEYSYDIDQSLSFLNSIHSTITNGQSVSQCCSSLHTNATNTTSAGSSDQTTVIAASAAVSSVIICFIVMVAPVAILWIRVKNKFSKKLENTPQHVYDEVAKKYNDQVTEGCNDRIIDLLSNPCYEVIPTTNITLDTCPAYSSNSLLKK